MDLVRLLKRLWLIIMAMKIRPRKPILAYSSHAAISIVIILNTFDNSNMPVAHKYRHEAF